MFGRTVYRFLDISGIIVICGQLRGPWVGFFNLQACQPLQCDAMLTLCMCLNSIRLLNVRKTCYSTTVVIHLPVRFVRVMFLEVHISLAAFSRDLPTMSRRPHRRWCLARCCVIGLSLTQVLHVHETRANIHHLECTWPQRHNGIEISNTLVCYLVRCSMPHSVLDAIMD